MQETIKFTYFSLAFLSRSLYSHHLQIRATFYEDILWRSTEKIFMLWKISVMLTLSRSHSQLRTSFLAFYYFSPPAQHPPHPYKSLSILPFYLKSLSSEQNNHLTQLSFTSILSAKVRIKTSVKNLTPEMLVKAKKIYYQCKKTVHQV